MLVLAVGVVALAGCKRNDEITIGSTVVTSTSVAPSTSVVESTTTAVVTTTVAPATTPAPTTAPATTAPATAPTTDAATTTTLAPGACPSLPSLPAGSVEASSKLIDVDADGASDTVRSYSVGVAPAAGSWHVRVELAVGGGVDLTVPEDPAPAAVKVLGGTYVGSDVEPGPGGLRPVIFVTTGAGASASIVTLFRLDGCNLVRMTVGGAGEASFGLGGGVAHAESLRCEGVAGTLLLVDEQIMLNADGVTFDVTDTAYTRTLDDLVVYGAGPQTTNVPAMPTVTKLIDCPNVDVP
jgi:hypothetical protein